MQFEYISAVNCAKEITGMANRSFALLNTIDEVVASVSGDVDAYRFLANQAIVLTSKLKDLPEEAPLLDPEGNSVAKFIDSLEAISRLYHDAEMRRSSAINDPELTDEDGVADVFSVCMEALLNLHRAIENLREAIETIDAMKSPVIGSFDNVEELFKVLDGH